MASGFDWSWLFALAAILAATGIAAGVIAGLLGVGGGIIVVPVLFHLFAAFGVDEGVRMHLAVGTSLATIIPTSFVSARAHYQRGAVDVAFLRGWLPAIVAGVALGIAIGGRAQGSLLTGIFAAVALIVAADMAFRREGQRLYDRVPTGIGKAVIGVAVGALSTLMGIGGGTLTVPILSLCNYPIRRAVGTAAAIGLVIAVPGTLGFIFAGLGVPHRPPDALGYVSVLGLLLLSPLMILFAPRGARLAHTIAPGALRKAFALFLALTAAKMLHGLLA